MNTKNKVGTFTHDHPQLGACCACRLFKPDVRNVVCLSFKAPVAGTGWGCVQCGLALDGAVAVICDDCLEMAAPLQELCHSFPADRQRAAYTTYAGGERHHHRLERHPELAPCN